MNKKMNKKPLMKGVATTVVLLGSCFALAAPQRLLDPAASADGRFWRDVDVSGWQLKGTGRGNVEGRFEAADGFVKCTIARTGFFIIVL